jgi:hypothetical protein
MNVIGTSSMFKYVPPLHVRLYIKQILEANAPWLSRGRLKHETPELWVKDGSRVGYPSAGVNMVVYHRSRRLTLHRRSVRPEHRLLQRVTSHLWLVRQECPPGEEKVEPCGCSDHSIPLSIRS